MRDSSMVGVTLLVCVVVALLNVAAHWFPWSVIPGAPDAQGRLRRLPAYAYGTGTILAGMVALAIAWTAAGRTQISVWMAVLLLALVILAAGTGTLGAYLADRAAEHRALVMDMADFEARIGL